MTRRRARGQCQGHVRWVQQEGRHRVLTLTEAAASKAAELLRAENRDDLSLRIAVQPGGCAGLRYQMYFDDRSLDGDRTSEYFTPHGPIGVVVDRMSHPYLQEATVDFADTIEKQGFTISNPAASSSCACGDSFS